MRDFLRKDPRAAQEMYERFAPRVFGLGLVMLGNPTQAEDLVQDTFVKVWRSARTYDSSRGSVDTWVLLIAPYLHSVTHDPLLYTLYGGFLGGAGVGLVFRAQGTTGGDDIGAQLLNRASICAISWLGLTFNISASRQLTLPLRSQYSINSRASASEGSMPSSRICCSRERRQR